MPNRPFHMEMTIDGIPRVVSLFNRLGEAVSDLRPAFDEIGESFKAYEEYSFSRGGPGWKPLKPRYAAWKATHYPGRPILTRTASLRESLKGGPGYIQNVSRLQGEYGTSNPVAMFHQRGTRVMVARKPIDISAGKRRDWAKIIQRSVIERARGGGAKGLLSRFVGMVRG